MFGLGAGEVLVILFLALIFIGPKKLPELAKGLGKGIREFQKAKNDLMDEMNTTPTSVAQDQSLKKQESPPLSSSPSSQESSISNQQS